MLNTPTVLCNGLQMVAIPSVCLGRHLHPIGESKSVATKCLLSNRHSLKRKGTWECDPMHRTTKLRVVLEVSLYPQLTFVLNNFRMNIISKSADVSWMFWEVQTDRNFHCLLVVDADAPECPLVRMKCLTFHPLSWPLQVSRRLQMTTNLTI